MTDLLAILTAAGLDVTPVGRWQDRKRPGAWAPVGVMVHHTAGTKSLQVIVGGRSDLPGPLANLHIPKDATVNLVSGGRCNHAGAGSQVVLDRVRRDLAPSGDAGSLGYPDGPGGNGYFYGIEAENLGDGKDPWPPQQLRTIARAAAALCQHHQWTAARVIGHREWTRRKPDPRGFAMPALRAIVAEMVSRSAPQPNPQEAMMRVSNAVSAIRSPNGGVWVLGKDGAVYAFGGAPYLDAYNTHPEWGGSVRAFVAIVANDRGGYDLLADDGALYSFGPK